VRLLRQIAKPIAMDEWAFLDRLLEVADSSMTYRARYYTTLHPLAVLDVLLADETNPRSLVFQLEHLGELYEKLPLNLPADLETIRNASARLQSIDLTAIRYPSRDRLRGEASGEADGLTRLDVFLTELQLSLPSWSNHLSNQYFSLVRTQPITLVE
jgi:uncharacterized alpha-E superfamily protein